jgi:hypothetical protein
MPRAGGASSELDRPVKPYDDKRKEKGLFENCICGFVMAGLTQAIPTGDAMPSEARCQHKAGHDEEKNRSYLKN